MYRKLQIETVDSAIIYLKYVVDITSDITVQVVNPANMQLEYELERVNTISTALKPNQFVVDGDTNSIILNYALEGKKIVIIYYTDGKINPFYASSNLHTFIAKVIKWTSNRIVDGLYIYWDYEDCNDSPIKKIKEGSFVYNGLYHIYRGGVFDIRDWAPPTVVNMVRGYKFFINDEIIQSYLDNPTNMLTKLGILSSDEMYQQFDAAKLDVMNKYRRIYNSDPLTICYGYCVLNQNGGYDFWFEYPSEMRTL